MFQQSYKTTLEAYRLFIQGQGIRVARGKFYEDVKPFVQPDKSLLLSDLVAYVRDTLKIDPSTGQLLRNTSPAAAAREQRLADIELERAELDLESKKKALRKEDGRWMEVADHVMQMAAFAGLIDESFHQEIDRQLPELVDACGGNPGRMAELARELELLCDQAFTAAVRFQTQEVSFEDQPEAYADEAPDP